MADLGITLPQQSQESFEVQLEAEFESWLLGGVLKELSVFKLKEGLE